jgi:chaperonin GroES
MLKPLHDNLLVKIEEIKDKKQGGLILPEAAKEKSKVALVLEVGPGKLDKEGKRSEPIVKQGDRILFRNYAEHKFSHQGEDYLIVSETDVLAIVSL